MSAMDPEAVREALKLPADTSLVRVVDVLRRAESHIAERVGPLTETEVVDRVRGRSALALSTTPVIELVSVTAVSGGTSLDIVGLHFDDGLVRWSDGRQFAATTAYTVTYTAGHARTDEALPGGLETAVIELCRHLWRGEQRGSSRRSGTAADESRPPGFLFPYIVQAAMEPYLQVPV